MKSMMMLCMLSLTLVAGTTQRDIWVPIMMGDIITFIPHTQILQDRDNDGIDDVTDTPKANPQSLTFQANGSSYNITLSGSDNDNPITYTIVTQPLHGTLTGTAPNLTYIPDNGYSGEDSFTFRVSDGMHDSSVVRVSIVVEEDTLPSFTLTYTAGNNGSLTGTRSQIVEQDSNGTAVTAVANSGYHFVQWSDNQTVNPRIDSNVQADINVSAVFAQNIATDIVYISWDNSGDYNCDGTADQEQINAALAEVASSPQYTTVYLKGTRTYWINEPIAMPSNAKLTGDASAKIQLVDYVDWPGNKPLIYPAGQAYWESRDGYDYDLVTALYGRNDEKISNVEISGFEISGGLQDLETGQSNIILIQFYRSENIKIHDMHLSDSRGDIIRIMGLETRSRDIEVYNNLIEGSGHEGISFVRVDGAKAYNNRIFKTRTNSGIRFTASSKIYAYGNTIGNKYNETPAGYAGIYLQIQGFDVEFAEIYDNYIFGKTVGILAYVEDQNMRGENIYIHHNSIFKALYYNGRDDLHGGIRIVATHDTIVEYNTIEGSELDGVVFEFGIIGAVNGEDIFDGNYRTIVRNNIISHCGGYGITSYSNSGKHHFELSNNNIYNCSSGNYNNTFTVPVNDIYLDPMFANTDGIDPAAIDLHMKSANGRWNGQAWVNDVETSPVLKQNDITIEYGAYGDTPYASKNIHE